MILTRGIVVFLSLLSMAGNAHNIKLQKSQSSYQDTAGIDAAISNESYITETDTFLEGQAGYSRSTSTLDQTISENKSLGLQVITPSFLSVGLTGSQYENASQELKTRTIGIELGKKFFYSSSDSDEFKPNFGAKIRMERINFDQSKTLPRRKLEFGLEQTSTGLSLSLAPISWLEGSASYYRNRYREDVDTMKARLERFENLATLFSNLQNTLSSLSETSKSFSLRFLPASWIDTSVTRTFSEDLITDTQFYVDSVDIGIYYFPSVYLFLTAGENFSSIDSTKTKFTEISIQFNF
jgi:hypothetical protein